jgi:hypothetical protein
MVSALATTAPQFDIARVTLKSIGCHGSISIDRKMITDKLIKDLERAPVICRLHPWYVNRPD